MPTRRDATRRARYAADGLRGGSGRTNSPRRQPLRASRYAAESDRGVQFTSWAFSQKVKDIGLLRRWELLAAPTTMRWLSPSGAGCRLSS